MCLPHAIAISALFGSRLSAAGILRLQIATKRADTSIVRFSGSFERTWLKPEAHINQTIFNYIELLTVIAAVTLSICFLPRYFPASLPQDLAPLFSKRQAVWIKIACSVPTLNFLLASAYYGLETHNFLNEVKSNPHGLYCGTSVTGGLTELLNLGAPLSFIGLLGFFILIRHGFPSAKSIVATSVLNLTCIAILVLFGSNFYRDNLAPFTLSQAIWWLPAGV
jgi:hypothetical protein